MEHKTYGIWNLMIQKKIDKDLHESISVLIISLTIVMMIGLYRLRVYRIGLNMKFGFGSGGK